MESLVLAIPIVLMMLSRGLWRKCEQCIAHMLGWEAQLESSKIDGREDVGRMSASVAKSEKEEQLLAKADAPKGRAPVSADLGHLVVSPKEAQASGHPSPQLAFPCPGTTSVRCVQKVLMKEECDSLITNVKQLNFSAPQQFAAQDRVCERIHTVDTGLSDKMLDRLRPFVPEVVYVDGARWRLTRFTHHWRYVRYFAGGHFAPHYDGAKLLPWHEMSMFTVQVYLNSQDTDFTGGETHFFMDFKPARQESRVIVDGSSCSSYPRTHDLPITASLHPSVGDVLIFDHAGRSAFHSGGAVTSGSKYIMRSDLLYAAIPEDLPLLLQPTLPAAERTWCPMTANQLGTRDFTGQVWLCECAMDQHGAAARSGTTAVSGAAGSGGHSCCSQLQATSSRSFQRMRKVREHDRPSLLVVMIDAPEAIHGCKVANRLEECLTSLGLSVLTVDNTHLLNQALERLASGIVIAVVSDALEPREIERRCHDKIPVAAFRVQSKQEAQLPTACGAVTLQQQQQQQQQEWSAFFRHPGQDLAILEEWIWDTAVPRVLLAAGYDCGWRQQRPASRSARH